MHNDGRMVNGEDSWQTTEKIAGSNPGRNGEEKIILAFPEKLCYSTVNISQEKGKFNNEQLLCKQLKIKTQMQT